MEAKYHLAVAERMLVSYGEYPEKRFMVGVINEGAKAASRIIRAFLAYDGVGSARGVPLSNGDFKKFRFSTGKKRNLKKFLEIAPRYLDGGIVENLVKILEVERAQKVSPVEFAKGDKIILLIRGKYRVVTVARIREFVGSVGDAVAGFSASIKR